MQILNYDYILEEQISELPLIETGNVKFIRRYNLGKNSRSIDFQTELHLKKTGEIISNTTELLALKSKELGLLLQGAGFDNLQYFSDFKETPFGGKHLPLVVSAIKKQI